MKRLTIIGTVAAAGIAAACVLAATSTQRWLRQQQSGKAKFHTLSVYTMDTILSQSKLHEIMVYKFKVDRTSNRIKMIPFWNHGTVETDTLLFIDNLSAKRPVAWKVETPPDDADVGMLTVDGTHINDGDVVEFGVESTYIDPDGSYVGRKSGAKPINRLEHFSGCFKIANGLPYSVDHNDGVAVAPMAHPGAGFHGWCYRYVDVHKNWKYPQYYLHYFSASSAPSWKAVAQQSRALFARQEALPSTKLQGVVDQLDLRNPKDAQGVKVRRIVGWMNQRFHYSGEDTYPNIPQPFDVVLANGFGDCKGLSLVMLQLLHAAGVEAHLALLNGNGFPAFSQNAANLGNVNHVAVYLPADNRILDPTVGSKPYTEAVQIMDTVTDKIIVVPPSMPAHVANTSAGIDRP